MILTPTHNAIEWGFVLSCTIYGKEKGHNSILFLEPSFFSIMDLYTCPYRREKTTLIVEPNSGLTSLVGCPDDAITEVVVRGNRVTSLHGLPSNVHIWRMDQQSLSSTDVSECDDDARI